MSCTYILFLFKIIEDPGSIIYNLSVRCLNILAAPTNRPECWSWVRFCAYCSGKPLRQGNVLRGAGLIFQTATSEPYFDKYAAYHTDNYSTDGYAADDHGVMFD